MHRNTERPTTELITQTFEIEIDNGFLLLAFQGPPSTTSTASGTGSGGIGGSGSHAVVTRKASSASSSSTSVSARKSVAEEEFFCLTPEDARSISSSGRSRNASAQSAAKVPVHVPETKIFSVAVEAKPAMASGKLGGGGGGKPSDLVVCDVDTDYTGRFAVVSSSNSKGGAARPSSDKSEHVQLSTHQASSGGKKDKKKKKKQNQQQSQNLNQQEAEKQPQTLKRVGTGEFSVQPDSSETEVNVAEVNEVKDEEVNLMDNSDNAEDDLLKQEAAVREKLLAEALQSTVIEDDSKNSAKVSNVDVLFDDDEKEFVEMSKADKIDTEDDDEEEEVFKIKEDVEEKEAQDETNLVDLESTATGCYNEKAAIVDKESEIVKSIEKAGLLYKDDDIDDKDNNADNKNNRGIFGRLFNNPVPSVNSNKDLLSSEDDTEFKPVSNRKKKKKKNNASNSSALSSGASSFADSESSEAMMEKNLGKAEGWSFETDDQDVNALLSEVTNKAIVSQEKAALEDVFKFDSELAGNDEEDANDNDNDKEVQEDEPEESKMSASLNENLETSETSEDNGNKKSTVASRLSTSMTGTSCSTSDTSVGNSPNPRATSKKSKKSKKKKR